MQIIMTKTRKGSEDGVTVKLYKAGIEYPVSDALGSAFIKSKSAQPAPEKKPVGGNDNKGGKGPSENK